MKEITAPHFIKSTSHEISVFLAGTIDLGNSRDWQSEIVKALEPYECKVYNPRKGEWDSHIAVNGLPVDKKLEQQIQWEQYFLFNTTFVAMWLEPNSKSVVSMMELGQLIMARKPYDLIVGTTPEFYRYGNVATTLKEHNHYLPFNNFEDFKNGLVHRISAILCYKN